MKAKILLSILLTLFVNTNLFMITQVSAQGTPIIQVEPSTFTAPVSYVNETFNINITLKNAEATDQIIGVQFRLTYDPDLLEVVDVVEGPFLTDPRWNWYGTIFMYFIESDSGYGPHVLVGDMIFPNITNGEYDQTEFPSGNGTIATITFKEKYQPVEPDPSASCVLGLADTMILDSDGNEITHDIAEGYYEVESLPVPTLIVNPSEYYASTRGEVFDINVDINNVDARWRLIGVQFRLTYDPELLDVLDVVEGSFLTDSRWNLYGTFFVYFVESDGLYGPHVLVGDMIFPNTANGEYDQTEFPSGSGTIATITFNATGQTTVEPEPPANCTFELVDIMLLNDLGEELPFNFASGYYEIPPLLYPIPEFSYEPAAPSLGEVVLFNASESYDPDYEISTYTWNFGDGTIITTTEPFIGHAYAQLGTLFVTLTVTDIDGLSASITKPIPIGYYTELTVDVDVGSIHFKGEIADFNILTTHFGKPVNATKLEAKLYFNGILLQDLSSDVEQVDTGLCRIVYSIPADAEAGTYTLLVKAEYYEVKGASLRSFLISPTLTNWNQSIAMITEIKDGIATITTSLDTIKVNLTDIDAKLVSIEGNIATISSNLGTIQTNLTNINATITGLIRDNNQLLVQINTALGTLTTRLDTMNATITQVNGNIATISTTLGEVDTKLDGVQSTATTTLYVTSILSAIAAILAAVILMFLRKR